MQIKSFWNDVISQNREALSSYFTKDALIFWHCTNEQFSVEEYIKVNCDYPGKWAGEIERIVDNGNEIILAGHVYSNDKKISCHVVSFIKIENEKICRLDEYWADDGEVPDWRIKMNVGKIYNNSTKDAADYFSASSSNSVEIRNSSLL